jgi:hypothetical protein
MEGQLLRSKPTTAATRYRDEAFSRDLRLGPFSRLRGQSTTSGSSCLIRFLLHHRSGIGAKLLGRERPTKTAEAPRRRVVGARSTG